MSWSRRARVDDEAVTINTMLITIVWCANEDRRHSRLQLFSDVGERVTERTTCVNRAFTEEVDAVALIVCTSYPEVAHIRSRRDQLVDYLTKLRVFALMVNLTALSEDHGLAAADSDRWAVASAY